MILNIRIKGADPFTASQVLERITPLLNNSEHISFDYKQECEMNPESYKSLLGILLSLACRNVNQSPICLERTDTCGGTYSTGAGYFT